ncbi:MAG: hypothetical protein L0211_01050 [Planctomycetaceae bacterium]|nr:hypothetical protein [Planctomycetaceae bacterium]
MEQAILDKPAAQQSQFLWTRVLLIAVVTFVLPIVFVIASGSRGPSQQEQSRILESEAQAQARVAGFHFRKSQELVREWLELPPPPADWPPDALAAYEEMVAKNREYLDKAPRYDSVFERAAAGDHSPELERERRQVADELDRFNRKSSELEARMAAAHRQWREARERVQRLAEAKEKRETGYGLGMTMEGYLFLKDGMSKLEVDLILDHDGGEQVAQHGNLEIYHWHEGFKGVHCTFRNGGLISKAQFGL